MHFIIQLPLETKQTNGIFKNQKLKEKGEIHFWCQTCSKVNAYSTIHWLPLEMPEINTACSTVALLREKAEYAY